MPKIIALTETAPKSGKLEPRWEKIFSADSTLILGRGSMSDLVADWENHLSRRHARLAYDDGRLKIEILPDVTNPLAYQQKTYPGGSSFAIGPGERFSIGKTVFEFRDDAPKVALDGPTPTESKTIRSSDLDRVSFNDAEKRLEALADFQAAMRDSADEGSFVAELLKVMLKGIPLAEAAAVAKMPPRDSPQQEVTIVATRSRGEATEPLHPSRKLIVEAIHTKKDPVYHTWDAVGSGLINPGIHEAGGAAHFDWAFCVPVPQIGSSRWGVYVTGRFASRLNTRDDDAQVDQQLNRDMRFAGLLAKSFASYRKTSYLQNRFETLVRFLSGSVRQAMARDDLAEVLRPREADVTALFCDLRGSCRISEEGAGDLMGLLGRISEALSIMTSSIIAQKGVIGDFQGDAAMGFWGWPLDAANQAELAAQAALTIRQRFENAAKQPGNPLFGFACGVGIASGRAVAGALGTSEQLKVSVYGPPVNLASRLESLTKVFKVPILIDDATAEMLRGTSLGVRRLAKIRPYGLTHSFAVSELYQPMFGETMTDDERGDFDVAYEHFVSGEWRIARRKLEELRGDHASLFLIRFMNKHPNGPPEHWDGVIPLDAK